MMIIWGFEPFDKTYTECLYSVIIVISAVYMLKPDLTLFFYNFTNSFGIISQFEAHFVTGRFVDGNLSQASLLYKDSTN